MRQIEVIEYLPKIMSELKKGVLISTKNASKINTMTISWGQIGFEWAKLLFTTYIREERFTFELIEKTREFTVSIPLERTSEISKAIAYCGSVSGKNTDKFKNANLTPLEGIKVNSPAIKELPLTLEAKVIYSERQNPDKIPENLKTQFYPSGSTIHTVYYGEIVNAYILE